jgi:peroxiredoxin Q/BCP
MAGGILMNYRLAPIAVFVIALALTPLLTFAASVPPVGSLAPEFTLTSQAGTPASLKDYRGEWVVLYFYPKDFSSGCTIKAHNFQRDQPHYLQRNASAAIR